MSPVSSRIPGLCPTPTPSDPSHHRCLQHGSSWLELRLAVGDCWLPFCLSSVSLQFPMASVPAFHGSPLVFLPTLSPCLVRHRKIKICNTINRRKERKEEKGRKKEGREGKEGEREKKKKEERRAGRKRERKDQTGATGIHPLATHLLISSL